jgi:hypothetical protein
MNTELQISRAATATEDMLPEGFYGIKVRGSDRACQAYTGVKPQNFMENGSKSYNVSIVKTLNKRRKHQQLARFC